MKYLFVFTVVLLGLVQASDVFAKECSPSEAYAAEVVTDYLDSWENVHVFFKQFRHCYDGSIAEGAEDRIQLLWSGRWSELSKMIALTKSDAEFKAFLWPMLESETFPHDLFAAVVRNAQQRCSKTALEFCRAVQKAAIRK